jgi:hypothetical protein
MDLINDILTDDITDTAGNRPSTTAFLSRRSRTAGTSRLSASEVEQRVRYFIAHEKENGSEEIYDSTKFYEEDLSDAFVDDEAQYDNEKHDQQYKSHDHGYDDVKELEYDEDEDEVDEEDDVDYEEEHGKDETEKERVQEYSNDDVDRESVSSSWNDDDNIEGQYSAEEGEPSYRPDT